MLKRIVVGLVLAAFLGTSGCLTIDVDKKEKQKHDKDVSAPPVIARTVVV
jgi:hypothetical protein